MTEYKRYTKRDDAGIAYPICKDCELYGECGFTYRCCYERVKDRLAELEDMIEQNVLIKLPCKVGDTVYWVFTLQFDEEYEVYRGKVRRITVDTHEVWVQVSTRYGAAFERTIDEIGKTLFLTKAEAEAKLEELKRGGKNETSINV